MRPSYPGRRLARARRPPRPRGRPPAPRRARRRPVPIEDCECPPVDFHDCSVPHFKGPRWTPPDPVAFVNKAAQPVDLFYWNGTCEEIVSWTEVGGLQPVASLLLESTQGHAFRARAALAPLPLAARARRRRRPRVRRRRAPQRAAGRRAEGERPRAAPRATRSASCSPRSCRRSPSRWRRPAAARRRRRRPPPPSTSPAPPPRARVARVDEAGCVRLSRVKNTSIGGGGTTCGNEELLPQTRRGDVTTRKLRRAY